MSKEEIITGLKNAMARGESFEKAANSLLSAGYSQYELDEAAKELNMSRAIAINSNPKIETKPAVQTIVQKAPATTSLNAIKQEVETQKTLESNVPTIKPLPKLEINNQQVYSKSKNKKTFIILTIFIALFLIIMVSLMIFGEEILKTFFG
jgi:hypothetical protein